MNAQASSATYSLITYSNAYANVTGPREALAEHSDVRFIDVLRDLSMRTLRVLSERRLTAQRNAGLRRAAREVARVEAQAREFDEYHPAMAGELRAAASRHLSQFD